MACVFCGGKIESKKVTFMYENGNKSLFVENVPAEVCVNCGERTYSPEVTKELLKLAKEDHKPTKTIQVPVFDFAGK
ncbi:type II toxin-antitoxin system MqsA family antitoxin [bacterium]|nr:type II toxin-antitoxin system MqsA family antitoxin [bacterium]